MSFTVEPVTDATALQLCKYIVRDDARMVDSILEYCYGDDLDKASGSKINDIYVDCNKSIKKYYPLLDMSSDKLDKACLLLSEKIVELNHPQQQLICNLLRKTINEITNMVSIRDPYDDWHKSQSVLWIEQRNETYKSLKILMRDLINDTYLAELNQVVEIGECECAL